MSFSIRIVAALILVTLLGVPARTLAQAKQHTAMTPAELKWGPAPPAAEPVILRRQPDRDLAHVRIAEGVSLEDLRRVLQHDQRAGGAFGAFQGHRDCNCNTPRFSLNTLRA